MSSLDFHRLSTLIPTGVLVLDLSGRVLFINDAARQLLGAPAGSITRFEDLAHGPDREALLDGLSQAVKANGRKTLDCRLTDSAGTALRCRFDLRREALGGSEDQILVTLSPATAPDEKSVEQAIAQGGVVAQVLREAPVAVAFFDRQMCYLGASERWVTDYRLQDQSLIGRSYYEDFPDPDARWREIHQHALQGQTVRSGRELFVRSDGSADWITWDIRPWREPSGEIGGVLIFTDTLTETIRLEESLQRMQHMEVLGALLGGFAHAFNDLLGVVVGNLDSIVERHPPDALGAHQHQRAMQAAERAARLTASMISMASRSAVRLDTFDINHLIADALPLIRIAVGAEAHVRSWLVGGSLNVSLDDREFFLALLNCVLCARDSLHDVSGHRELLVRSRMQNVAADELARDEHLVKPGWYALVEVIARGNATETRTRPRVMQQFWPTQIDGNSNGLTFLAVRSFAQQLGGNALLIDQPAIAQGAQAGSEDLPKSNAAGAQGEEPAVVDRVIIRMYLPLQEKELQKRLQREADRLEALRSTDLLDSADEPGFDALVSDAAGVCGTPFAFVSLVDQDRQWFKARFGLQVAETSRDLAFCAHAIENPQEILVVPDARLDERFSGNPLVTGAPGIRFYAGVPLTDSKGHALGTLCVVDLQPRELGDGQLAELRRLAHIAAELIAARGRVHLHNGEAVGEPGAQAGTDPNGHATEQRATAADLRKMPSVLIVDDEEGLCDLACNWFEGLGFDTVGVHDPDSALGLLRQRSFDLLFTDVVMPGSIDGVELAREARRLHPEMKVLITSGYAASLVGKGTVELPGPLLPKPYRKPALFAALQKLQVPFPPPQA